MGLFGFIGNLASATVKVALTPIAVVKDVVEGDPFESTGNNIKSASQDLEDAIDELL